MKIYKYLLPIRNLLEYLKENLSKEEFEKIRKVLKKRRPKCKCCGKICKWISENYYYCEECNIAYYTHIKQKKEENNGTNNKILK